MLQVKVRVSKYNGIDYDHGECFDSYTRIEETFKFPDYQAYEIFRKLNPSL
jgi:hypothetical protein